MQNLQKSFKIKQFMLANRSVSIYVGTPGSPIINELIEYNVSYGSYIMVESPLVRDIEAITGIFSKNLRKTRIDGKYSKGNEQRSAAKRKKEPVIF